jgi:hypothetical protein
MPLPGCVSFWCMALLPPLRDLAPLRRGFSFRRPVLKGLLIADEGPSAGRDDDVFAG